MRDDDYLDEEDESPMMIKIMMPSALISEYSTVYKVSGNEPYELRDKLPSQSKVKGVRFRIENDTNESIRFLISRTFDVVTYDTPLCMEYEWHDGIYSILEDLERIDEEFEAIKDSGDEEKINKYSNYKIGILLPISELENGELVYRGEKGIREYKVYKPIPTKNNPYKMKKIKASISLDNSDYSQFEVPANAVFLVGSYSTVLKMNSDIVKIERTLDKISDLISIVSNFIDYAESK